MAYLPATEVFLDAILTKKGREALARGTFEITQVAFGDDEIDYTLFDPAHPSGSAFYGEAIQRIPVTEAIPDENQILSSRLVTLPRGTTRIPIISTGYQQIILKQGGSLQLSPQTLNYGTTSTVESAGYLVTVADSRLVSSFTGVGLLDVPPLESITPGTGAKLSHSEIGLTFSLTAQGASSLFTGSATQISTSIIIVGRESGARLTIPLIVQKK